MNRLTRATVCTVATLAAACATAGKIPDEIYDNIGQAMEAEIEPFAEAMLPAQLTKDAEAVDFAAVETAARRITGLFEQMQDSSRKLYEPDSSIRNHAQTAAVYFGALATAAAEKNHGKLVQLAVRKGSICANCHN